VFYVIVFSLLSVLLVAAGLTVFSRNRRELDAEDRHSAATAASRRSTKDKRAQSRQARRKRK
jgi:hypothetical protein